MYESLTSKWWRMWGGIVGSSDQVEATLTSYGLHTACEPPVKLPYSKMHN